MLVPLVPRLLLLVLVSLQTHSTLFLVPALELVNVFIPEGGNAVAGICDVTGDCNILVIRDCDSLPQTSQQVTSDIVIPDVTHDCDLWDGEYYVISLSGHFGYLENNAKVLALSVLCIARFI